MREIDLDIAGLGIMLYSPSAVAHIPEGSDYLQDHFQQPADVARHVMAAELTAFCTGSPGTFRVRLCDEPLDEVEISAAEFKLRLGLQIQNETICLRDLYDLMNWSATCPSEQQFSMKNGWSRLTVCSSRPASGILGDGQVISIYFESWPDKPSLRWEGVPQLCEIANFS